MSAQIEVGDLVMVIKPKPCGHALFGYVFFVTAILPNWCDKHQCWTCGAFAPETGLLARGAGGGSTIPLWRLKKVHPLAEPETVETDERITA